MTVEVVVVAGETSGDRIVAGVAKALASRGIRLFGLGGASASAAGVELLADLGTFTGMGTTEVIGRLPKIAGALARLMAATRRRRPRAAILVDYTEVNLRVGRWLRARRIPVLWCVAPQVWAWRPNRAARVARSLDRLAVVLPFEEPMWRRHGVDARYVGHPALDVTPRARAEARGHCHIPPEVPAVALMPGSRPHELAAHLPTMLAAFEKVRQAKPRAAGRLLHAPSAGKLGGAMLEAARRAGIDVVEVDPIGGALAHLSAFDAAIVTSGTATLECALAGASPVIVYRASWLTAAIARRSLTTRWIGLPNVILGRGEYPELLQERFAPEPVANATVAALASPERTRRASAELHERLACPTDVGVPALPKVHDHRQAVGGLGDNATSRMAAMLDPWLEA